MPRRGQYSRSFFRRPSYGYGAFNRYPGGIAPETFGGGSQFGGDIVSGINQILAQRRMDEVANQILSQRYGVQVPQKTGFNWWGGGGGGGGMAELQLRQQMAQQDLADQLKRAQIQNYLRLAQRPSAGQLTPAQQLAEQHRQNQEDERLRQATLTQAQKQQAANTDTLPKVLKDFSALYPGKATDDTGASVTQGEAIYNSLNQGSGARGNVVNGQFIGDPNGEYYTWQSDAHGKTASAVPKVKWDVLQPFINRVDAIQKAGGSVVPPLVARALPVSGQPGAVPQTLPLRGQPGAVPQTLPQQGQPQAVPTQLGDEALAQEAIDSGANASSNLPQPSTQDEYDALDSGASFVDGDGQVKVKP
jgi:hypothetical protein